MEAPEIPNEFSNSSSSSTPFATAPSSPGRSFFSAPSSPMHFILSSSASSLLPSPSLSSAPSPDFEFSSRFPSSPSADADDLFLNGQIRPLLPLPPLNSLTESFRAIDDTKLRCHSVRRRARSLSPPRNKEPSTEPQTPTTASRSSSSSSTSSTSSTGRTSKKWMLFKDLILRRSKSEGSNESRTREKFWQAVSFAKPKPKKTVESSKGAAERRGKTSAATVSAHERHYKQNRGKSEGMRRKTALPYRQQGILGWMGFNVSSNTNFTSVYSA